MEEIDFWNKVFSYLFYISAILLSVVSIIFSNAVIFLLSVISIIFAAVYFRSGHILNNFLIKHSRVIEIKNGYFIGSNQISAIRRQNVGYLSVSIALLRIEKTYQDRNSLVFNAIENAHEAFDFTVSVREMNRRKILEMLETKLKIKEIYLKKINPGKYDKINSVKREIEIIRNEISNFKKSESSFDIAIKISSFAESTDSFEASSESGKKIEKIAAIFSSALNADYDILSGEALLNAIGC